MEPLASLGFWMPWSNLALRFVFFALILWRAAPVFPAWSRACHQTLGQSFWSALGSLDSSKTGAHPGHLLMAFGGSLTLGLTSFFHLLDASSLASSSFESLDPFWLDSRFWSEISFTFVFSFLPFILISSALSDSQTSVGIALQQELAADAAKHRAESERRALDEACPPSHPGAPKDRPPRPRL